MFTDWRHKRLSRNTLEFSSKMYYYTPYVEVYGEYTTRAIMGQIPERTAQPAIHFDLHMGEAKLNDPKCREGKIIDLSGILLENLIFRNIQTKTAWFSVMDQSFEVYGQNFNYQKRKTQNNLELFNMTKPWQCHVEHIHVQFRFTLFLYS